MSNWYIETFRDDLMRIDQALRDHVKGYTQQAPIFWQFIDQHFAWDVAEPSQSYLMGGKRIRPLLMMLVARALKDTDEHVMPVAAGLEMIHNFTLIHDDIMDNSTERRHRPTLWSQHGVPQAINTGDGLYTIGILTTSHLSDKIPPQKVVGVVQGILTACLLTVEGQALDIAFESRDYVSPEDYLHMIDHKTGPFIRYATRLAAYLSTDDEHIVQRYTDVGLNLGTAFQIWDDYLGVWGDPDMIGKSAVSDIVQKKKSYPITYAFANASGTAKTTLETIYQQDAIGLDDVETILQILDDLKAKEKTKALVDHYYNALQDALTELDNGSQAFAQLKGLAQFFIERSY